jgi:hypothetical protein
MRSTKARYLAESVAAHPERGEGGREEKVMEKLSIF